MGISKINYGNRTLIDLTADTVTADKLVKGITAHDKAGNAIVGTMTASASGTTQIVPTAGNTPVVENANLAKITATNLTDTNIYINIPISGRYRIKYSAARGTNYGGLHGTQLYRNGVAIGTENTNFEESCYQNNSLDYDLNKGDTISIWARCGTWGWIAAGNLSACIDYDWTSVNTSPAVSEVKYSVIKEIEHLVLSNISESIAKDSSYSAVATPKDGYKIKALSVMMRGRYYDFSDNHTISIDNVDGDIYIYGKAEKMIIEPSVTYEPVDEAPYTFEQNEGFMFSTNQAVGDSTAAILIKIRDLPIGSKFYIDCYVDSESNYDWAYIGALNTDYNNVKTNYLYKKSGQSRESLTITNNSGKTDFYLCALYEKDRDTDDSIDIFRFRIRFE